MLRRSSQVERDWSLLAAITMGTEIPINVTLRWRDSDGEPHERTQMVTLR